MERKHVGGGKRSQNSVTTPFQKTKNQKPKLQQQSSSSSSYDQMILGSSSTITTRENPDLPCSILIEILGRLPIKTLVSCGVVCKSWRSMLSETYFYNLYSLHMSSTIIFHIKGSSINTLKQLYTIESINHNHNGNDNHNHNGNCDVGSLMKKLRFIRRGSYDRNNDLGHLFSDSFRYQVGNSCNGLVCIRELETREPTLVWNPMMGQFAVLPKPATSSDEKVVAGFGFCGRTCRYKVVRIYHKNHDPLFRRRVEIYEFGVGVKWRETGNAPFPVPSRIPGFYTNNSIHWILDHLNDDSDASSSELVQLDSANSELICGFDFVEEEFKVVSSPPIYNPNDKNQYNWSNLGIMGGCLSICAIDAKAFRADVQVWVMEEYGVPESWALRLSIRDPTVQWWNPHRWMQVTNVGRDGEVLMLCAHSSLLDYSLRERRFRSVEGLKFPAISITPSLISMEDVLCFKQGTGSLTVRYL